MRRLFSSLVHLSSISSRDADKSHYCAVCGSGSALMGSSASVDVLKHVFRVVLGHVVSFEPESCLVFLSLVVECVFVLVMQHRSKQTGQISLTPFWNPASCALIGPRADWPSLWLAVGSVWVGGASKVWNRKWINVCEMRRESFCGIFLCQSDGKSI